MLYCHALTITFKQNNIVLKLEYLDTHTRARGDLYI